MHGPDWQLSERRMVGGAGWKKMKGFSKNEIYIDTDNTWWQLEERGLGVGGGGQREINGDPQRLRLGWWVHDAVCRWYLENCTLETHTVLLTNVTQINSIFLKNEKQKFLYLIFFFKVNIVRKVPRRKGSRWSQSGQIIFILYRALLGNRRTTAFILTVAVNPWRLRHWDVVMWLASYHLSIFTFILFTVY